MKFLTSIFILFFIIVLNLVGCSMFDNNDSFGSIKKSSVLLMNRLDAKGFSKITNISFNHDIHISNDASDLVNSRYLIQGYVTNINPPTTVPTDNELLNMWKMTDYVLVANGAMGDVMYDSFNLEFKDEDLNGQTSPLSGTIMAYYKDEELRTSGGSAYVLWVNGEVNPDNGFAYFYKQGEIYNQFYFTWEGGNLFNEDIGSIENVELAISSFDEEYNQWSQYFVKHDKNDDRFEYAFFHFKKHDVIQPMFDLRINETNKNKTTRRQIMTIHIQSKDALYGNLVTDDHLSFYYILIVDHDTDQNTYTLAGRKQLDGGKDASGSFVSPTTYLVKKYDQNFSDITPEDNTTMNKTYNDELNTLFTSMPRANISDHPASIKLKAGENLYRR